MNQQHPAGWYPQPDGSQRYWDGRQWTNHVAPAQAAQGVQWQQQDLVGGQSAPKSARPWFARKRVIIPAALLVVAGFGAALSAGSDDAAAPAKSASPSGTPAAQNVVDDKPTAAPSTKPTAVPTPVVEEVAASEPASESSTPASAEAVVPSEQATPDDAAADVTT